MPVDLDLSRFVVAFLNDLLVRDPEFISEFFQFRVECGKGLADHPSVQVLAERGIHWCGVLGLLNGLCGTHNDLHNTGPIAMTIVQGKIVRFTLTDANTLQMRSSNG